MLLLLQAAAQHLPPGLPPIYVTVQQPAGGMPEWVRTLISAGVGALFGILSSTAMEFVKPILMKRTVRKQVIAELKRNMKPLQDLESIFQSGSYRERDLTPVYNMWPITVEVFLDKVSGDRYKYYFEMEKAAFYSLDDQMHLTEFYSQIETARFYCKPWNDTMLEVAVRGALEDGMDFLNSQGCDYKPSDDKRFLQNNESDKETSA
jgi:hypothetical protein